MSKKPKKIRRIFKVLFVVIFILLALMIILPFVFKGKVMEAAKKEINKNLEAKVDFEDFGLNLFAHFPDFSFHLDKISVVGVQDFEGDTLASIGSVSVVLDLLNVVKGDVYEIKRISIVRPDIYLKVAENGKVNWDIALEDETSGSVNTETDAETGNFHIALKKIEISDAHIIYDDVPGDMQMMVSGLNHSLSGDLSADKTSLQTKTGIAALTFVHSGVKYLNKALIAFDASIDADLKNEIYSFQKNTLSINELSLQFDGSVAMAEGDPNIILTFNAPKNTFRNFLSLVPAIYQQDFKDIETEGDLSFNGYVKGVYTESSIPSFKLEVLVGNASFKYPDLPSPVSAINLTMNIDHPGGDIDLMTIDIRKFNFSMMDKPFDMTLFMSTPMSDPDIDTRLNGRIDLSAVSKVYPLGQGEEITGVVDAGIRLKGRLSAFEKKAYNDVEASGSLLVKDLSYTTGGDSNRFDIKQAQMNFAPAYIDLVNLDLSYGKSDLNLKGKLENYLPYLLSDQTLIGNFSVGSKYFNADQLIGEDDESNESQASTSSDTMALTAFMVPAHIDFKLNTMFKTIIYDNMELTDVTGQIIVKDEKLTLSKVKGNLLGGTIGLDGGYDTRDTDKPIVDLEVSISKISFQNAFATFGIPRKFAPIFEHAIGDFSTSMSFNTLLNNDMSPDWMNFIGQGMMNTSNIKLDNVNTLNKLSEVLKVPSLQAWDVNPLKVLFEIKEGKLMLKPMDIIMGGMKANLSGWTALDETIGYDMKMEIPRKVFGGEANNILDGLVSQANAAGADFSLGETVKLDVVIGGTLSNPSVKPAIGSSGKGIIEDISNTVQQEIDKKKEELEKEAKAEAQRILNEAEQQAQKVIAEAQNQADQIRKTARDAAQKIRTEADAHAKTLIAEGKKKGMLAEAAAKKAAEEYKKKAYSEADQMILEADKKADGIVNVAKQQAAKIRSDAQKKVDAL